MKSLRKRMSAGLSFAAGTLFGAVAVFVPLAPAGHPGSNVQRPSGAVRSSAPAAAPSAASAALTSPENDNASRANDASNETTCDVQLN